MQTGSVLSLRAHQPAPFALAALSLPRPPAPVLSPSSLPVQASLASARPHRLSPRSRTGTYSPSTSTPAGQLVDLPAPTSAFPPLSQPLCSSAPARPHPTPARRRPSPPTGPLQRHDPRPRQHACHDSLPVVPPAQPAAYTLEAEPGASRFSFAPRLLPGRHLASSALPPAHLPPCASLRRRSCSCLRPSTICPPPARRSYRPVGRPSSSTPRRRLTSALVPSSPSARQSRRSSRSPSPPPPTPSPLLAPSRQPVSHPTRLLRPSTSAARPPPSRQPPRQPETASRSPSSPFPSTKPPPHPPPPDHAALRRSRRGPDLRPGVDLGLVVPPPVAASAPARRGAPAPAGRSVSAAAAEHARPPRAPGQPPARRCSSAASRRRWRCAGPQAADGQGGRARQPPRPAAVCASARLSRSRAVRPPRSRETHHTDPTVPSTSLFSQFLATAPSHWRQGPYGPSPLMGGAPPPSGFVVPPPSAPSPASSIALAPPKTPAAQTEELRHMSDGEFLSNQAFSLPMSAPCGNINRFALPNGESVSCVLWSGLYHVTGTDIGASAPLPSARLSPPFADPPASRLPARPPFSPRPCLPVRGVRPARRQHEEV